MPPAKSKQPPFEELFQQLEQKVAMLEQGGLSLDDSLSAYEEAVGLAKACQQMLDGAELRITKLRAAVVSAPAEEPDFDPDEFDGDEDEGEPGSLL